jgi:hypothetical protein
METFAWIVKRDSMNSGSTEVSMARKRIGQLGWGDRAVSERRKQGRDRLARIGDLIDWPAFERLLTDIHPSRRGEPSYPPLMMFKGPASATLVSTVGSEMEGALRPPVVPARVWHWRTTRLIIRRSSGSVTS